MKPSTKMPTRSYPGLGRCIYCTQPFAESELTDEHIVPMALNGTLLFKKAACDPCRSHSNEQYENKALQTGLLVPRLLLELKRRHKKNKKPLPLVSLDAVVDDLSAPFTVELELAQYPPMFSLIKLPLPGRLAGIERSGDLADFQLQYISFHNPSSRCPPSITTKHAHDHTAFGLMVAKIAYCFAIAERGLDSVEFSELRALLLGRRDDLYNFVGSAAEAGGSKSVHLHWLSVLDVGGLCVARVHLFASFGASPYLVVLGRSLCANGKGVSQAEA